MAKTLSATDSTVLDFIASIPSENRSGMEMIMYDTEPTPFGTTGGEVSFDIGFKSFNPFGNKRGQNQGGLVYEVLRSREIMGHLIQQKKLANSTADEYYYVTKMLADEGWFSNKIDEIPNYGERTKQQFIDHIHEHLLTLNNQLGSESLKLVNEDNVEETYLSIISHLKVNRESVDYFEQQQSQNMTTVQREMQARRRADSMKTLLDVYADFINRTNTNQEAIRALQYENIKMHKTITDIRKGYFSSMIYASHLGENLDYHSDIELLNKLAKQGVSGATEVKPVNTIMKEFESLYSQKGMVGVMGHNISSDLRWTTNLIKRVEGADKQYLKYFDETSVNNYCSQQMLDRLYSLKGTDLVETFLGLNNGELYSKFKQLAETGGLPKLGGHGEKALTLETIYSAVIDADAKQPHTARGDIDWTIDVVQHYAKEVEKFFKED